jgi:hypothetical protein
MQLTELPLTSPSISRNGSYMPSPVKSTYRNVPFAGFAEARGAQERNPRIILAENSFGMSSPSERLRQLVREFHSVADSLNDSPSVERKKELRVRMEFLNDEIDRLIFHNAREKRKTP